MYRRYEHIGNMNKTFLLLIGGIILIYVLHRWYTNSRINSKKKSLTNMLALLAKTDPKWNLQFILKSVEDKFYILMDAWVRQDIAVLRQEAHPKLVMEWERQIRALQEKGEANSLSEMAIHNMRVVTVKNKVGDVADEFTICIDASAIDQKLIGGVVRSSSSGPYREFWTFQWSPLGWQPIDVAINEDWERYVDAATVDERNSRRKSG